MPNSDMPVNPWLLVLAAVFAIALCSIPRVRIIPQMLCTLIHEIGHGIVSLPFGGGFRIWIHPNTAGETVNNLGNVPWLIRKPVRIIHVSIGYAAPLILGVALLYLALHGQPDVAAWILVPIGVLTLAAIRNPFGWLMVILFLIAVGVIFSTHSSVVVFAVAVVLLLQGFLDVCVVTRMVFSHEGEGTDFHILAAESFTHIPAVVWLILWFISWAGIGFVTLPLIFR